MKKGFKNCKAVIFDFDGVIGKTMEDNFKAWQKAFNKYKIEINRDDYFQLEGLNTQSVVKKFIRADIDNQKTVDKIIGFKEKYYLENNSFKFYPGAIGLLLFLKRNGKKLGLVSGASYPRLANTVKKTILSLFEVIITGDKVNNSKPHPESYLKALALIRVKKDDCLVVENAPIGVESAKRAGLYCIAVTSTLDKYHLGGADMIIKKISDLKNIFMNKKTQKKILVYRGKCNV